MSFEGCPSPGPRVMRTRPGRVRLVGRLGLDECAPSPKASVSMCAKVGGWAAFLGLLVLDRRQRSQRCFSNAAGSTAALAMQGLPPGVSAASASDLGGLKGFTQDPNEQAAREQQEGQKAAVLKQILAPEALNRLGRVKLVKKDKVEALEMKLIQMAMRGEIQKQLSDEVIVNMLEEAGQENKARKVQLARKVMDSDSDNDDDLW